MSDMDNAAHACIDGVKEVQRVNNANDELKHDYNDAYKAWELDRNKRISDLVAKNAALSDAYGQQVYGTYSQCRIGTAGKGTHDDSCRAKLGDGYEARERKGCQYGGGVDNGWTDGCCCKCWGWRWECGKTNQKLTDEQTYKTSIQNTLNDTRNEKFNRPLPNYLPVPSVSCAYCKNIQNIIGSTITDSTLKQVNDCISEGIKNATPTTTPPQTTIPATAPPPTIQTPSSAQTTSPSQTPSSTHLLAAHFTTQKAFFSNSTIILIIFLVIFTLLVSLSSLYM